jgi:hypothetical protein
MFVRGKINIFCVDDSLIASLSDHSALCVTLPWAVKRALDVE